MELDVELTKEEYLTFYDHHWKQNSVLKKCKWFLIGFMVLMVFNAFFKSSYSAEGLTTLNILKALLPGLVIIIGYFMIMRSGKSFGKRLLKKKENQNLLIRTSMKFTEENISFKSEKGESTLNWNAIIKSEVVEDFAYLYVNTQSAIIIPHRALGDKKESFLNLLSEKTSLKYFV